MRLRCGRNPIQAMLCGEKPVLDRGGPRAAANHAAQARRGDKPRPDWRSWPDGSGARQARQGASMARTRGGMAQATSGSTQPCYTRFAKFVEVQTKKMRGASIFSGVVSSRHSHERTDAKTPPLMTTLATLNLRRGMTDSKRLLVYALKAANSRTPGRATSSGDTT